MRVKLGSVDHYGHRVLLSRTGAALLPARPRIFDADQGNQFAGKSLTARLKEYEVRISMDGKGRAFDNIMSSACGEA